MPLIGYAFTTLNTAAIVSVPPAVQVDLTPNFVMFALVSRCSGMMIQNFKFHFFYFV